MNRSGFIILIAVLFGLVFTNCESEKEPVKADVDETDVQRLKGDTTNVSGDRENELMDRVRANPDDHEGFHELAYYYFNNSDLEKALEQVNHAIRINDQVAAYHFTKGDIYHTMVDVENAEIYFNEALKLDPNFKAAHLKLARIHFAQKDYDETILSVNEVLRLDVNNAEAYFLKGFVYEESGDSALASSSYLTAIEQDPQYYDAYIRVGLMYANTHNSRALDYYNSALNIRPQSIEALYCKAMFCQENKLYEMAIQTYSEIADINPSFIHAYFNSGFVYLQYGDKTEDWNKAVEFFSLALQIDSKHADSFYNRGLAYEKLGDKDKARSDYQTALQLVPGYIKAADALNAL